MPDISSKEKAQVYIGLDMKTLTQNKENWKQTVVPKWIEQAKSKQRLVSVRNEGTKQKNQCGSFPGVTGKVSLLCRESRV
jgi:hypothetical protein